MKHHRKVAVKVLRADLAAALGPDRFLQEIEIAAQLQHPNILALYDSGEADGFLFYVMPYIEGPSLRDKLAREGELPVGDAVRILRDVVDALTAAHAHGVVHCDIKPENILLSGRHALVTDFGVAKAVSEATGREMLTTAGVALGTPAYMAPEQASADPHLDQRVDIYAVGAVAYELLTGRPVFMGTTPQMVLAAHMTEPPQPVTKHRDTVPAALESVVMRCLEKRPADRWQSAEELLPHLEALATPSGGMTPTDTRPMPAPAGRRPWFAPTAAAVAFLAAIVFVFSRMLAPSLISVTTTNIRAVTSEQGEEWLPALSPDGSQVAFQARRAGWWWIVIRSTLNIGGGGELIPAQGVHEFRQTFPNWSSDGEFVRFWSCPDGRCNWWEIAKLGGSISSHDLPRNTRHTSWSPDGSRVAFIASGDSIFTHSIADGTTSLLAVPEVTWALHSLAWSPDGKWIAYVNGNPTWVTSFNVAATSIWIVGAEGGEPVRVTGDEFMDVSPTWLENDHLLFVSNRDGQREVFVVEVGPTGPRGELQKVPGAIDPHSISYSIAGRKLAFSKATISQNIWSYPIAPGPFTVADGRPVTSDNALIEEHDISPDGRWIAYDQNIRGNMDIFRRPVDGGSPMPITDSPVDEFAPQWSPDGSEIAFYTDAVENLSENAVMVVRADGGMPAQVALGPGGLHLRPKWSPSGLDIAFRSYGTDRREVWLVSRATIGGPWGEATKVTDFGCTLHDWAPDGSGILCNWRPENGGSEIVLVSRDGEILWRHAVSAIGVRPLTIGQYSMDGSELFFWATHEDGTRGMWAMPMQGGEPRLVIALDNDEISALYDFSVGPDHLYVTVGEYESDIWVMDVEVER